MQDLVHQKKKININFSRQNFCLSSHYNSGNSYLFVNGKEINV